MVKYIVTEIQTYKDGSIGILTTDHLTQNEAESKYHAVLSAAAVSDLPRHSAIIYANDGMVIGNYCYYHEESELEG